MNWQSYYKTADITTWQGRKDALPDDYFFQTIQSLDLLSSNHNTNNTDKGIAFLGFCCDEGVSRNLGRPGAKQGPAAIRQQLAKIPNHQGHLLYDAGDIVCENADLESSQQALGQAVSQLLNRNCFPIIFGGGHETAWGHYQGLAAHFSPLSILNFDAHFDLRDDNQSTSGTPFKQIADSITKTNPAFDYTVLGIQTFSNTKALFQTANKLNVCYLLADAIQQGENPLTIVQKFIERAQHIYLTICLDVFAACYAPGVSAVQANGLTPNDVIPAIKLLANSGKVVSMDVVELAPNFDIDHRTAKLAALLISEFINNFYP